MVTVGKAGVDKTKLVAEVVPVVLEDPAGRAPVGPPRPSRVDLVVVTLSADYT